jgi:hypothetical protein
VRGVQGRVTVKQLRERLVAEPSTESDLVTLRVRDSTAQGAADLAGAVGKAYEDTLKVRAEEALNREVEQARDTQKTLQDQLRGLDAKLEASPDATLKLQRDAVAGLLSEAQKQEHELLLRGPAEDPVSLLEQPEVPEEPAQPKPLRLVTLGGLLGSVLAAVLAWWLAGRRQPLASSLQPGWPAPLPGAKRAGFRARLGGKLRSRLPKRGKGAPDAPVPAPSVRADPEYARERLVAVLGSERQRQHRAGPGVRLGDESERLNGHHSTGNGSGAPKAAPAPDESNDEASPHG